MQKIIPILILLALIEPKLTHACNGLFQFGAASPQIARGYKEAVSRMVPYPEVKPAKIENEINWSEAGQSIINRIYIPELPARDSNGRFIPREAVAQFLPWTITFVEARMQKNPHEALSLAKATYESLRDQVDFTIGVMEQKLSPDAPTTPTLSQALSVIRQGRVNDLPAPSAASQKAIINRELGLNLITLARTLGELEALIQLQFESPEAFALRGKVGNLQHQIVMKLVENHHLKQAGYYHSLHKRSLTEQTLQTTLASIDSAIQKLTPSVAHGAVAPAPLSASSTNLARQIAWRDYLYDVRNNLRNEMNTTLRHPTLVTAAAFTGARVNIQVSEARVNGPLDFTFTQVIENAINRLQTAPEHHNSSLVRAQLMDFLIQTKPTPQQWFEGARHVLDAGYPHLALDFLAHGVMKIQNESGDPLSLPIR